MNTHKRGSTPRPSEFGQAVPNAAGDVARLIGITKRRKTARFLICDAEMNILFLSPELQSFSNDVLRSLREYCDRATESGSTVFHAFDAKTVFRIVPLNGQLSGSVAIFVDAFKQRGSVTEAAQTFGLTKREAEVLELLLKAKTNAEIARELLVAESTAADHIKSVMRKMGVSKRANIIAKVFRLERSVEEEHLAK